MHRIALHRMHYIYLGGSSLCKYKFITVQQEKISHPNVDVSFDKNKNKQK